jgi:hypothetical protein
LQTLIVEFDSPINAEELSGMLSSVDFVKKVTSINNPKEMIAVFKEQEEIKAAIVKKKNKAIAEYL